MDESMNLLARLAPWLADQGAVWSFKIRFIGRNPILEFGWFSQTCTIVPFRDEQAYGPKMFFRFLVGDQAEDAEALLGRINILPFSLEKTVFSREEVIEKLRGMFPDFGDSLPFSSTGL